MRPQLFDLREDPNEFHDLGEDPAYAAIRAEYAERLFDWMRHRRIHTTIDDRSIAEWTDQESKIGIHIGRW